jgi:TM2 domain-containing membrane protein YozV
MSYKPKSVGAAYFWMLFSFVFVCGLQHFYLGKPLKGLVWLFTFGLLGIGLVWDLFTLPHQVRYSR